MEKKVAVITGASSGIGLACGQILENEYIIYNLSRSIKEETNFFDYKVDVNDYIKVEEIAKEIFEKHGRIDLLINNAGFGIAGAIENCAPEKIYSLVDTNLSAVMTLSSIFIPYLKLTKGKIVNISSVGGLVPLPYQAVYSATKAGVEIFSRALSNELKDCGIKVCAILPGDVKTNFTSSRIIENNLDNQIEKSKIENRIKKIEKDELSGKGPESVAKVVCKVVKMKNPPLRKTVGISYKLVCFLTRILPTKFMNYILKKIYCK